MTDFYTHSWTELIADWEDNTRVAECTKCGKLHSVKYVFDHSTPVPTVVDPIGSAIFWYKDEFCI